MDEDFSADVVSATLEVIYDLIKSLGPIFLENNVEKLVKSLKTLIQKEGKCQIPVDEEDDE